MIIFSLVVLTTKAVRIHGQDKRPQVVTVYRPWYSTFKTPSKHKKISQLVTNTIGMEILTPQAAHTPTRLYLH